MNRGTNSLISRTGESELNWKGGTQEQKNDQS